MRIKKIFLLAAGVLLISSLSASEQPNARELAARSYHYTGALDRYTFRAVLSEEMLDGNHQWKVYKQQVYAEVDRPDRFRIETKSEGKERTSFLNDGIFTMADHGFHYYGQIETPKEIDRALDFIFKRYGINAPLAALLYRNMQHRIHFTKSRYFGRQEVAGVSCDYVAFQNSQKELHLWISHGKEPLVRSFVLIDRRIEKRPRITAFIEWDTHPEFGKNEFVFVPSKNMVKVSVEHAE